jgi:ferredoxin
MPKITFEKDNITQQIPAGCDFQRALTLYPHLPLRFGCRRGECGVCALYIEKGMENLTKVTPEEKATLARKRLPSDCRLGCQCAVNGDIIVGICPPSQSSSMSSPNSPDDFSI